MENATSVIVALMGFVGSVMVAFMTGRYMSKVEPTKSKLKKAEILFDLRVTATKEFNAICQKYDPLNLGELHDGDIYGEKRWVQIREDISKYKAKNSYVFEDNKINKILDKILLSLEYSEDPTYMSIEANQGAEAANDYECECYKTTIMLLHDANDMIKKYLFEESSK